MFVFLSDTVKTWFIVVFGAQTESVFELVEFNSKLSHFLILLVFGVAFLPAKLVLDVFHWGYVLEAAFHTVVVRHLTLVYVLVTELFLLGGALAFHVRRVQLLQDVVLVVDELLLGNHHVLSGQPVEIHFR